MSRKITTMPGFLDTMDHYDETGKCIGHTTSPAEGVYYHYDEHWKKIGSSSEGLWGSYNNYDAHYNRVGSSSEIAPGIVKHYDDHWDEVGKTYDTILTKQTYLDDPPEDYFSADDDFEF